MTDETKVDQPHEVVVGKVPAAQAAENAASAGEASAPVVVVDPPQEAPVVADTASPSDPSASAGSDRIDALEAIVTGLSDTVSTLVGTITDMAKDSKPKGKPWTHWGGAK